MMGFIGPVQPPDGTITWQKDGTTAFVEKQDLSNGTLYIAESHVSWINPSGQGFVIPYPAITVHAISKDLSHFPKECLYLMIDSDIMSELRDIPADGGDAPGNQGDDNSDDGYEEEEGTEIREIRFIPQDKSQLQTMFDAMSQCQALHPDPEDPASPDSYAGDDQEEGEEGLEEEGEGFEEGNGAAEDIADGDAMDTGQFEDADMGPAH